MRPYTRQDSRILLVQIPSSLIPKLDEKATTKEQDSKSSQEIERAVPCVLRRREERWDFRVLRRKSRGRHGQQADCSVEADDGRGTSLLDIGLTFEGDTLDQLASTRFASQGHLHRHLDRPYPSNDGHALQDRTLLLLLDHWVDTIKIPVQRYSPHRRPYVTG